MKYLILGLTLILTSCGSGNSVREETLKSKSISENEVNIDIKVSNHFKKALDHKNENEAVIFKEVITQKSQVTIPVTIAATNGVSGFRWLTLNVGNKQYCYQGDGFPGGELENGKVFVIRGIQDKNEAPCYERKFKEVYSDTVHVRAGDIISSQIHGKVCIYFCEKLEAQFSLSYLSY